jgi:cysteine synthase
MTRPHPRPYDSVLDTIGWTPLIRLSRLGAGIRTPIYGKAEYANPGGSVKDRIAVGIIEAAERTGELKAGGTIVEGTSGNTGVGLAIAAALKGYRCIFTMPDKMSQEKVRLLKAFGAEVVITPTAVPPDHPENYVMKAKQIVHDHTRRDPRQPVLQPGEPRGALPHDRSRALGADRGPYHALHRRGGNRRDGERRGQVPQGEKSGHPGRRG